MSHPRTRLDDIIHQPVRLSIMAALAVADEVEFGVVRDVVEVSDSLLSQHSARLEEAGYLHVRKGHVGKRPRTWFSLTTDGRAAFDEHLAALQAVINADRDPRMPLRQDPPTSRARRPAPSKAAT